MPDCFDCPYLDRQKRVCIVPGRHKDPPGPTSFYGMRRCSDAILEDVFKKMRGKILEVGFGWNRRCEKLVKSSPGMEWFGIDPRWKVPKNSPSNKFHMSVDKMDFQDGFFDCVYASQSMEHWGEKWGAYQDPTATVRNGLAEVARVLKPGGIFFADVPMNSHGHKLFKGGDEKGIERLFDNRDWFGTKFDRWGKDCSPLSRKPGEENQYVFAIMVVRAGAV